MTTDTADPAAYVRSRLGFEIDVMDVAAGLPKGGFVLVDTHPFVMLFFGWQQAFAECPRLVQSTGNQAPALP